MTDDREVFVPMSPEQSAALSADVIRRMFPTALDEAEALGYRRAVEKLRDHGYWKWDGARRPPANVLTVSGLDAAADWFVDYLEATEGEDRG